jgi:hypothetical protein
MKACPQCGKEFTPTHHLVIYCCADCRIDATNARHRRITPRVIKCAGCGKPFQPKAGASRYCSQECRPLRKAVYTYPPRRCVECNTQFIPINKHQKTCCIICSEERKYRREAEKAARHQELANYFEDR